MLCENFLWVISSFSHRALARKVPFPSFPTLRKFMGSGLPFPSLSPAGRGRVYSLLLECHPPGWVIAYLSENPVPLLHTALWTLIQTEAVHTPLFGLAACTTQLEGSAHPSPTNLRHISKLDYFLCHLRQEKVIWVQWTLRSAQEHGRLPGACALPRGLRLLILASNGPVWEVSWFWGAWLKCSRNHKSAKELDLSWRKVGDVTF